MRPCPYWRLGRSVCSGFETVGEESLGGEVGICGRFLWVVGEVRCNWCFRGEIFIVVVVKKLIDEKGNRSDYKL